MDYIAHEEVASVQLFNLKLSEGELMLYESCIAYVMENCTNNILYETVGCDNKIELKSFQDDLQVLIKNFTNKVYWSDSLKKRLT